MMLRGPLDWGWLVALALPGGLARAQVADSVEAVRRPAGDLQLQVVSVRDGILHRPTFRGDPAAGNEWYAHRAAGETDWSAPLPVNHQAGSSIATGTMRGPQLAVGPRGRVHVA